MTQARPLQPHVRLRVRVDNIANRNYVGTVIIADGNRRFFEPALPSSVSFIVNARRES